MKIAINEIGVPVVVEGTPEFMMPKEFSDWFIPKMNRDLHVFEFGCGNSTLAMQEKVRLIGVEHNLLWWLALQEAQALNVLHRGHDETYEAAIDNFWAFDVVFVDGVRRDHCIRKALPRLTPQGVIILDNSDSEAQEGQAWLREQGFAEKVFSGTYAWAKNGEVHSTTIFWRPNNCLGIQ